ncbi:putative ABC transport system permease protein [Oxalobacteraceae bacterium GrIS 2.11]
MLLQSLRMTWRDWRAGELRFLLVALVVAVGALSSVGFFVDRVSNGLQRDANQLLGADLVINSDAAIGASLRDLNHNLAQAQTASFVSMAVSSDEAQTKLVAVKAVSSDYPLRGHLTLDSGIAQHQIPAPGTIWVDRTVLVALHMQVGQQLKLGDQFFTVTHLIQDEPDRGSVFMNIAPRVLLAETDLPATHLILPGSRVTYKLLLAGDIEQVRSAQSQFEKLIEDQHLKGVNIESFESGRPEMSSTLDRAKQFLSLVSLLSAMLAALAIALAARRFMLRHVDACAMLRCLGMTQTQVTLLFLIEFLILGLVASFLGAALGYLGHLGLLVWLGSFITTTLPPPSILPALQGIAIGLLLLLGFAIPPIMQLRNVPHNLMVRRETGTPQAHTIFIYLIGLVMFGVLLVWQTGNLKLASYTFLGFLLGFVLFAICAWFFLRSMKWMRNWSSYPAWRFAINALQRRPAASVVQVVALSLGLMALLLLTIIRADLLTAWRQATPANAPNQFVVNILPEQKDSIAGLFKENKITIPDFYPMIRGRLIAVNDVTVSANDFESDSAKRLIEREFNLSTMPQMQNHNQLISGHWFANDKPEASVEEGIAKTLHLKLGDKLRFNVAEQQIDVEVTSLRKLEWSSMQVNFFVIVNPKVAADLPRTWITSFHLPSGQEAFIPELSKNYSNLTVIDTGAILRQLQNVLDQVVAAVQFLFLFTIACGLLVLYAALQSSQQQRLQEASLLRALGASKKQLSQAQWIEYGLLGSLAGLLAASGAAATGWVLAHQVFEFAFQPSPLLWLVGLLAGALCALAGGWLGLRHILNQPPLLSLREG